MVQAEAARYQRTNRLSASGTALIDHPPYVVHSPLLANDDPWPAVTDDGRPTSEGRVASTAVAQAYEALFPNNAYAQRVAQATREHFDPDQGYYEGLYETDGRPAPGFTSGTNSLILQAILHRCTGSAPLVQPNANHTSPWWQTIRRGDAQGQGLPAAAATPIDLTPNDTGDYWSART
jgi:hypothetical protein